MWKLVALSLLIASSAEAHDSLWLLCKGDIGTGQDKITIVASLFEHREGADKRAVGVTLMFGDNVGRGELAGWSGPLKVTHVEGKKAFFAGTGELNSTFDAFTLKGSLDSSFGDDAKKKLTMKLACETIRD